MQSQAALSLSRAAFHCLPALIQWASLLEGGPTAVLEDSGPPPRVEDPAGALEAS